jgi:hypothetical protein
MSFAETSGREWAYRTWFTEIGGRRILTLVVSGVRARDGARVVGLLGGWRRRAVLGWHRRGGRLPAAAVVLGEPLPAAPLGLVELREHVKPAAQSIAKKNQHMHSNCRFNHLQIVQASRLVKLSIYSVLAVSVSHWPPTGPPHAARSVNAGIRVKQATRFGQAWPPDPAVCC